MDTKFTISYDDQPNDVVKTISNELKHFGLTIIQLEGENGVMEYEIVKLK